MYSIAYYSERKSHMLVPSLHHHFSNGVKNIIIIRTVGETKVYSSLQDALPMNFDGMDELYFVYGETTKKLTIRFGNEDPEVFKDVSFPEAINIINNSWL